MSFNVRERRWQAEWARFRRGEHADFATLAGDVLEHRHWVCRHMLIRAPVLLALLGSGVLCAVIGGSGVSAYLQGKTVADWGLFLYCVNLVSAFLCGYQFTAAMYRFSRTLLTCRKLLQALAWADATQEARQKT